jgi:hypothetical protein
MRFLNLGLAVALVCVSASGAPAQDAVARAEAASMQKKLAAIVSRGEVEPASGAAVPLRTSFTEREVNSYFTVHGPEFLPEGVMDPRVGIDQAGRVRARAIVDLDQALKPKERSWLDPLAWVSGKMEVTGAGTLHAANGQGVLRIESATLGGINVPPTLLQELVTYYSRSSDDPAGFRLDRPFRLPSAIRAVETAPGRATIVQ